MSPRARDTITIRHEISNIMLQLSREFPELRDPILWSCKHRPPQTPASTIHPSPFECLPPTPNPYNRTINPATPIPTTCCTPKVATGPAPPLAALAATLALFETLLRLILTVALAALALALTILRLALAALPDSADEMLLDADDAELLIDDNDAAAMEDAELRFEEMMAEAEDGDSEEDVGPLSVA